jgi:phospholipid/cholesterol/gamma-HCH transport system permease protein
MKENGTISVWNVFAAMLAPLSLPLRAVLVHIAETGLGSLFLVVVTIASVGATMCDQAAAQALRLLGDQSFIGPEYIVLGFEEYGPLIVSVAFASRVGAGIAAHIATLSSEKTLDALVLYDNDPVRTILAPMGVATVMSATSLGLLSVVAWESAGILTMALRHGQNPLTFFHPEAVHLSSVIILVTKCTLNGILVFAAALTAGLRAEAGAEEVGHATTRAVIRGLVYALLANVLVDFVWFFVRGPA